MHWVIGGKIALFLELNEKRAFINPHRPDSKALLASFSGKVEFANKLLN